MKKAIFIILTILYYLFLVWMFINGKYLFSGNFMYNNIKFPIHLPFIVLFVMVAFPMDIFLIARIVIKIQNNEKTL